MQKNLNKRQIDSTTLAAALIEKNKLLKDSEAALLELNTTKDKFFSVLAHDLRSPFTGLLGMSEYLADSYEMIPKDELKDITESIFTTTQKIYNLLNNLLEWSGFQMGKIDNCPSIIDLNSIVTECIDLQIHNAESKEIFIINEINESIKVYADLNMLSTILRNLISNAIKFTKPGGRVILYASTNARFAEIKVKDTGIGMEKDVMDRIFRLDSKYSTLGTAGEEGTGLGLVLCRELIKKNNGEIFVNSEVKKGTEFVFTLPLA